MLTEPMNDDEWNETFTEFPVYDTDGKVIDCSAYAIKEACRKTVNTDGTPASRAEWTGDGGSLMISLDGHEYTYDYSTQNP